MISVRRITSLSPGSIIDTIPTETDVCEVLLENLFAGLLALSSGEQSAALE